MRVATSVGENPRNGAKPAMSNRSGKPLKKSPNDPSTSPATNHFAEGSDSVCIAEGILNIVPSEDCASCRAVVQASLLQPATISDRHAIGAHVQLRLQVERQQLRTLRLDNGNVLMADAILKAAQLLLRHVVRIVQRQHQP